MKKFRTVFMGTPDFSVPCLAALADKVEIIGVVTQPDKPKGRGQKLLPPPVKKFALAHDMEVYQPLKVKADDFAAKLEEMAPDLIIVVAFGQILSKRILDIPKYGCINVHASLLPRYRGAAPMQWTIINGETKTGVTTMLMDEGLDTGDMLLKREIEITPEMTLEELHDRMMNIGAEVLIDTLEALSEDKLTPQKQDDSLSNYAPMIGKDTGRIDWQKSAADIHNLVRGLNSWPGAYTYLNEGKYKIWRTKVINEDSSKFTAGEIISADKTGIKVATGEGFILITEIQAPNKKKMSAFDYLNGHGLRLPACFK